jgi:cell volume regulation protein A
MLVLALVARPLVVAAALPASRLRRSERAFIAWGGLKGAVPILLAAFAVLGGVRDGDRLYGLVFVVVLISVLGQGTLVPHAARLLGIPMRERPALPWQLSVDLGHEPEAAREFTVVRGSRAESQEIGSLPLGAHAWITLVVREGAALPAAGSFVLRAGDRVIVLAEENDVPALEHLFGVRASGPAPR